MDAAIELNEPDVICIGDFNADGSYYYEADYLHVFPTDRYGWLISNADDTTVADSDNTYDRIVTTRSLDEDHSGIVGVLRFDEVFDFSSLSIFPKNVSDHFPVWAEFYVDRDTD